MVHKVWHLKIGILLYSLNSGKWENPKQPPVVIEIAWKPKFQVNNSSESHHRVNEKNEEREMKKKKAHTETLCDV